MINTPKSHPYGTFLGVLGLALVLLVIPSFSAATSPIVATQNATAVTATAAVLNGQVNPQSSTATVWFEYGSTNTLGNTTQGQTVGNGVNMTSVAQAINGLMPNTIYYFRIAASNQSGTEYGLITQFTTLANGSAPTVTTEPPSSFSDMAATLTARINPNGQPTTFWFQYGTTRSVAEQSPRTSAGSGSTAQIFSASVSNLAPTTFYYFRVIAENQFGTSVGDIVSFQTSATPDRTPTATTLPPSAVNTASATITGRVNPKGSATTYWFQYGADRTMGARTSAQNAGSGSSLIDISHAVSGLSSNTLYYYRLVAENQFGTTRGDILTFLTRDSSSNPSGGVPAVATQPATAVTQTSAVLNAAVNPNNAPTTAWFEYGTTQSLGTITGTQSIGNGAASLSFPFTLANLQSNTTYFFRAVAQSGNGTTNGSILSFITTSPNNPGPNNPSSYSLTATPISVNSGDLITVAWTTPQITNSSRDWIGLYRSGSSNNEFLSFRYTNGARTGSFTFTAPNTAGIYEFRYFLRDGFTEAVRSNAIAVGGGGSGSGSVPISITNAATSVSQNMATVNGQVTPNNLNTSAWFEYGTTPSLGTTVGTQSVGSGSSPISLSFTLTGLQSNTTYYYRVVAQNSQGTAVGSVISFTTQFQPTGLVPTVFTNSASGITQGSATLNGTVNPNNLFATAWFEYGTNPSLGAAVGHQPIGSGSSALTFSFSLSSLQPNTTYYYRVVAQNSQGTNWGSVVSFMTQTNQQSGSAPSVSTTNSTGITQNSVILNGFVSPNSISTSAWFEYGTTPSLGTTVGTQSVGNNLGSFPYSYSLAGLQSNTTYYVRAGAQNSQGVSYGSIISFTTVSSGLSDPLSSSYSLSASPSSIPLGGITTVAWTTPQITNSSRDWIGLYRSGSSNNEFLSFRYTNGARTGSFTFTAPNTAGIYEFRYFLRDGFTEAVRSNAIAVGGGGSGSGSVPSITTSTASALSQTSAILNAYLTSPYLSATAWFEWGPTATLGNTTPRISYGTGSVSVSQSLVGLTPGTTYYFRAGAENSAGTIYGALLTFTTSPSFGVPSPVNPPTVSTLPATTVGLNSATLNGTITRSSSDSATIWFEWGASSNPTTPTSPQLVNPGSLTEQYSFTLSSLQPNTRYFFRAVARSSFGTTYGSVLSFVTYLTSTPPLTPTGPAPEPIREAFATGSGILLVPVVDRNPHHPGEEVRYTVVYKNIGTSAAREGMLKLVIPLEVEYRESTSAPSLREVNNLTFDVGVLDPGEQGVVTVTVVTNESITEKTTLLWGARLDYKNSQNQPRSANAYFETSIVKTGDFTEPTETTGTSTATTTTRDGFFASLLETLKLPAWVFYLLGIVILGFILSRVFLKKKEV